MGVVTRCPHKAHHSHVRPERLGILTRNTPTASIVKHIDPPWPRHQSIERRRLQKVAVSRVLKHGSNTQFVGSASYLGAAIAECVVSVYDITTRVAKLI